MIFIAKPGDVIKVNGSYYECRLTRDNNATCRHCSFDNNIAICQKLECTPCEYNKSRDVYFVEVFNIDSSEPIDELIINN